MWLGYIWSLGYNCYQSYFLKIWPKFLWRQENWQSCLECVVDPTQKVSACHSQRGNELKKISSVVAAILIQTLDGRRLVIEVYFLRKHWFYWEKHATFNCLRIGKYPFAFCFISFCYCMTQNWSYGEIGRLLS